MKVLLEKRRKIILALLMGAALLFLTGIMYNTYSAYTNMVVQQQQQHLLLISRILYQISPFAIMSMAFGRIFHSACSMTRR